VSARVQNLGKFCGDIFSARERVTTVKKRNDPRTSFEEDWWLSFPQGIEFPNKNALPGKKD